MQRESILFFLCAAREHFEFRNPYIYRVVNFIVMNCLLPGRVNTHRRYNDTNTDTRLCVCPYGSGRC